jgi:CheY-like chemotaxis protein
MDKGGAKKILLIEDDPQQIMIYETEFNNYGYKIMVADNGMKGIEIAKRELPDLIFLDMILGDIEGMQVLRKLKAEPKTKDLKVVVLSNLNKKELADEAAALGAIDYLVKIQYLPREIVEQAKKYLAGETTAHGGDNEVI